MMTVTLKSVTPFTEVLNQYDRQKKTDQLQLLGINQFIGENLSEDKTMCNHFKLYADVKILSLVLKIPITPF